LPRSGPGLTKDLVTRFRILSLLHITIIVSMDLVSKVLDYLALQIAVDLRQETSNCCGAGISCFFSKKGSGSVHNGLLLASKPALSGGFLPLDIPSPKNCLLYRDDLQICILHVLSDHALRVEMGAIKRNGRAHNTRKLVWSFVIHGHYHLFKLVV
jgi:hypothetical protein